MCETSGIASFTVVASGSAPFTYQWEYNNGVTWVAVADGTPAGAAYTNANTATLDVAGITASGNYQYRVIYYKLQLQVMQPQMLLLLQLMLLLQSHSPELSLLSASLQQLMP